MELPESFETGVLDSGFERLLIGFSHAERSTGLPLHHRDPFDRLLIEQAQEEDLLLVTHDSAFEDYEVEILWTGRVDRRDGEPGEVHDAAVPECGAA